jgi:hypothetical protein
MLAVGVRLLRRAGPCRNLSVAAVGRHSHSLRGTEFEEQAIRTLGRSHFRLTRTGGASDGGVDFQGYWHLAQLSGAVRSSGGDNSSNDNNNRGGVSANAFANIPVIGQCKHTSSPVGVEVVREFTGATAAFRAATLSSPASHAAAAGQVLRGGGTSDGGVVLGVLVASHSFTKNARRHSSMVEYPQLLVTLGEVLGGDGSIGVVGSAARHGDNGGGIDDDDIGTHGGSHDGGHGVKTAAATAAAAAAAEGGAAAGGTTRRVVSVLPNRAFLRAFPRIGFALVDAAPGDGAGATTGGVQPAFWYASGSDGRLVLM